MIQLIVLIVCVVLVVLVLVYVVCKLIGEPMYTDYVPFTDDYPDDPDAYFPLHHSGCKGDVSLDRITQTQDCSVCGPLDDGRPLLKQESSEDDVAAALSEDPCDTCPDEGCSCCKKII